MNKIRFLLLLPLLVFFSVSCTTHTKDTGKNLTVNVSEPNRIRFQGKGSAAGFMLSGSMGPMGIAIGVAIDEGIAKEIQSAADASGFMIEGLIRRAYQDKCHITEVNLERYGFKMKPGSDDIATASIDALIFFMGREPIEMSYPPEASEDLVEFYEAPLDELKSDGKVVNKVLLEALEDIFHRAC